MRECLSVHVGGAGVRVGAACWELYCLEHGIAPSGLLTAPDEGHHGEAFTTFFSQTEAGRYTPRAILVDQEPSVIDEVLRGEFRHLFPDKLLMAGKEDAGNCYARAYHHNSGNSVNTHTVMERIRQMTDDCDSFQGFLFFHSLGGGTGSGLTAAVMEQLSLEYPKLIKINFAIFPSARYCRSSVQPYNCVLSTHATMTHTDCTFLFDNDAMFDMLTVQGEMSQPSLDDFNSLIAQVMSSVTLALRFSGGFFENLKAFPINLVPFPRLHFPLISHSPVVSSQANHEDVSATLMTHSCFQADNHLLKCNPELGMYASCCLLYRGDVTPSDVNKAITSIKAKRKVHFVDWCPAGFKITTHPKKTQAAPGSHLECSRSSLSMLSSNSAIAETWAALRHKFDLLLSKKAFLHWYLVEGMEEQHFIEARDDLVDLEDEYEEMFASDLSEPVPDLKSQ